IPKGHPQRDDLERKQQGYEQDFNSTILSLFDKVLFPIHRANKDPQLASKPLDMTRDATKPFNGEEQIEKTLTSNPLKLYLDVEKEFDAIRDKAQDLLWPENQDEARWSDVADRYAEQAGMPWLPPRGIDTLRSIACNRGLWEELGNGYVTKNPKKKRTSAQVIAEPELGDEGRVRLRVNPQNAGPAPRIHYAEDAPVSEASPRLKDNPYTTAALRVSFLVCDVSAQYETGDPVTWSNKLILRNKLSEKGGKRSVELFVAPRGTIRYTLDGSEPRDGTPYEGAIPLGDGEVLLRAFAEADGLEAKTDFRFPAKGKKGVQIDDVKPGRLVSRTGRKLDSRGKTFEGLKQATEKSATFEGIVLTVGQGNQMIAVHVGEIAVDGPFIEALLVKVLEKFAPDTLVTMTFRKAHFASGHDLKDFAGKLGIELLQGEVEQ
ncbi:MAG: chitobiase/beta-hexosaminidase C-terminal domain-containing protein, partial [Bryobacteraceae bacterium]